MPAWKKGHGQIFLCHTNWIFGEKCYPWGPRPGILRKLYRAEQYKFVYFPYNINLHNWNNFNDTTVRFCMFAIKHECNNISIPTSLSWEILNKLSPVHSAGWVWKVSEKNKNCSTDVTLFSQYQGKGDDVQFSTVFYSICLGKQMKG